MDAPIQFLQMDSNAVLPTRGSACSAGLDLSASAPATVPARGRTLVHTGLGVAVPCGYYARIAPRSGLALKAGLDVGAGVVDADYRGEVGVIIFNHTDNDFQVKAGDRIAQLIVTPCSHMDAVFVSAEAFEGTGRGSGGFGSTGV